MTNNIFLKSLLTLHHVYPLTLNKLRQLLQNIDTFEQLETTPVSYLAQLLNIDEKKAFSVRENYMQALNRNIEQEYDKCNILAIPFNSKNYPEKLLQLVDPPAVLYAKGDISLLHYDKKIACIGSRKATVYSSQALHEIIPPLTENQYVIVSGLAKGADSLAHRAAIHYGGKTIAVLGHGFNYIYPKCNEDLARYMAKKQLLLTEYPPHTGPQKWHFPMRNRIISGLSDALVVTEAAVKSGTLITTEHALEHGKDVFVVPGPITSNESTGTNKLLREGAIPIWNGQQIIDEMQMFQIKN
ncbi:DNA-processing protein DprA [Lysinibacillus sp. 54212]|uniref:DNA-processing protein DprA n=1 Tax=Lysinibacillus sp. 54212 TaxID=3119829 RepID=UPI002FC8587C